VIEVAPISVRCCELEDRVYAVIDPVPISNTSFEFEALALIGKQRLW
jgi:hypothetical protein